jgi:hypothetical protein
LHSLGYINYQPSYNPFKGSQVILFNFSEGLKPLPKSERKPKNELLFEQVNEQALNKSCTSSGNGTEQALVPSINYINNTNILNEKNVSNLEKHTKNVIAKNEAISDNEFLKNETEKEKEKKLREKKKSVSDSPTPIESNYKTGGKEILVTSSAVEKPNIENVKAYFQENNFPEQEAQKFFNYFKSVGWLVGGKTPMVDWQAAAQNWIINSINFNNNTDTTSTNQPKQLNTTTDKNYAEPL